MSTGVPYPLSRQQLELMLKGNTNKDTNNVKFRIKLPDENRYVELYIDGLTHQAPNELVINMMAVPT